MARIAWGLSACCQVAADMIKIFTKEDWIPPFADKPVFIIAPCIIMGTVLMSFAVIPFASGRGRGGSGHVALLFFLGMSSLGVYSVALAGWSSNNKYSPSSADCAPRRKC